MFVLEDLCQISPAKGYKRTTIWQINKTSLTVSLSQPRVVLTLPSAVYLMLREELK